jgi:hypothetical protein
MICTAPYRPASAGFFMGAGDNAPNGANAAMKDSKPQTGAKGYRVYKSAEMYADRVELTGADPGVVVTMRLKTTEVGPKGTTESATPWVKFTPEQLASLGEQLVAIADRCRQWRTGDVEVDITSTPGIAGAIVPLDPKKAN